MGNMVEGGTGSTMKSLWGCLEEDERHRTKPQQTRWRQPISKQAMQYLVQKEPQPATE